MRFVVGKSACCHGVDIVAPTRFFSGPRGPNCQHFLEYHQ